MVTNILLAALLAVWGWLVLGWWLDEHQDETGWCAAHPPHSNPDHTNTVRLPIGGLTDAW